MEFIKLLKNTSYLASTRFIQFAAGLVRIKLIAYLFGTLGTGIYDQLTFVTQRISQFTLLSMSEAVVKQIAENKDSQHSYNLINSSFKIYFILVGIFMVITSIFLHLFSNSLTVYFFGDSSYISYFYVALFSFPILILDSIPFTILKAFKDVKTIAKARAIIVLINLLIVLPLIFIFGLNGAIAFVPISYIVSLSVNYFFANIKYFKKLKISFFSIITAKNNYAFLKEMLLFSVFGITVGVFAIISEIVCRSIVVSSLGIDNLGLYSPIIMWSSAITGFVLPAFSTYLYPKFCELKTNIEVSDLLNDGLRLGTFVILPLIFIGIPYKNFFISLFYTDDFLSASTYLPYHFLGVQFFIWYYVFSQVMTPRGKIIHHGLLSIMYFSIDIAVTYYFVEIYGLYGWMLKHIVSPFIFFWVYLLYVKMFLDFKLSRGNQLLMFYVFLNSLFMIFVDKYFTDLISYIYGPLSIVSFYWFLNPNEKLLIINKISLLKNKK
ncbi:oligosaccharide flippase family protein [Flavobacteriaceae bacterium]|nr:oligosaccharide flippase family protein [Flavobacteriaceae bacterium]